MNNPKVFAWACDTGHIKIEAVSRAQVHYVCRLVFGIGLLSARSAKSV